MSSFQLKLRTHRSFLSSFILSKSFSEDFFCNFFLFFLLTVFLLLPITFGFSCSNCFKQIAYRNFFHQVIFLIITYYNMNLIELNRSLFFKFSLGSGEKIINNLQKSIFFLLYRAKANVTSLLLRKSNKYLVVHIQTN